MAAEVNCRRRFHTGEGWKYITIQCRNYSHCTGIHRIEVPYAKIVLISRTKIKGRRKKQCGEYAGGNGREKERDSCTLRYSWMDFGGVDSGGTDSSPLWTTVNGQIPGARAPHGTSPLAGAFFVKWISQMCPGHCIFNRRYRVREQVNRKYFFR